MSLAEAIPQIAPQSFQSGQSSSAASSGSGSTVGARPKDSQIFEFTKRKRWADLLVTELSDAIILVLSPACKVWYCGTAVTDLLGWKEDELIDGDLADLMNVDDRASFRNIFRDCIHAKQPLLAYARLQCKNDFYMASDYSSRPREVLFEITGYAHFLPDTDELQCCFAMAKPYPSRNTAMLNTFLELKMENERLQQRLVSLRAQNSTLDAAASDPSGSRVQQYSQGQLPSHSTTPGQQGADGYYDGYDDVWSTRANLDGGGMSAYGEHGTIDEDAESGGPRKKIKRAYSGAEQYVCVTCGRTDSPEWRKGPLGPKTLCNACGLRWAKKVRTDNSSQLNGDGDVPGSSSLVF